MQISSPDTPSEFAEYFDLRWRLLRAPWQQPRGSEQDEMEQNAEHVTIHAPAHRLIAVGRLHMANQQDAQIRYMAVEADQQGQGVGRKLVEELERRAQLLGASRILLNARDTAVSFYQKLGYRVCGRGPTMYQQIHHTRMEKLIGSDTCPDK